jgi:ribosomal protein L24E
MRTYEDSFSGQKIYPGKVRVLFLDDYGVAMDDGIEQKKAN